MNDRKKSIAGGSSKEKAQVGKADQSPFLHFTADLVEEMEMPL